MSSVSIQTLVDPTLQSLQSVKAVDGPTVQSLKSMDGRPAQTPGGRIGVREILRSFRGRASVETGDELFVSAHRGVLVAGVPENSIPAILAAAERGCLAIEIDVRVTADGEVVCLHDHGIGRVTNVAEYSGRSDGYDRYKGVGWNPLVKDLKWKGFMDQLQLKDEWGTLTDERIMRLEQLLDVIREEDLDMVVMLDIKQQEALKACYELAKHKVNGKGISALEWCILKPDVQFCPFPADLEAAIGGSNMSVQPVFEPETRETVDFDAAIRAWTEYPSTIGLELEPRSPNGELMDLVRWVKENTDFRLQWYAALGDMTIPQDLPVKESWTVNRISLHEGTGISPYDDRLLPGESPDGHDYRGDLALYRSMGFSWVIADLTPDTTAIYAAQPELARRIANGTL